MFVLFWRRWQDLNLQLTRFWRPPLYLLSYTNVLEAARCASGCDVWIPDSSTPRGSPSGNRTPQMANLEPSRAIFAAVCRLDYHTREAVCFGRLLSRTPRASALFKHREVFSGHCRFLWECPAPAHIAGCDPASGANSGSRTHPICLEGRCTSRYTILA